MTLPHADALQQRWETAAQPSTSPEPEDDGLAYLSAVVASHGAHAGLPSRAARAHLAALIAGWRSPSANPPDLVGRPCPMTPPEWHWSQLGSVEATGRPAASALARRLYHARWLGYLLVPDRSEFRPSVTILIPTFNRAAMVIEAVQSALAQTWRPLEILVIDDGSTDDIAGSLARFGDTARVVRQPNRGVSSARNAGVRLTMGDFIHFLDSDNLLDPTAVARKIDAFARFPDAGLCYCLAHITGEDQLVPDIAPPDGSENCPTTSLLARQPTAPFYVSCVMMPRCTLLEVGGFDEDMRRAEDVLFWIRAGVRDIKAIGLGAHLATRRLGPDGLSSSPLSRSQTLDIRARSVAACLDHSRAWALADHVFRALTNSLAAGAEPFEPDETARRGFEHMLAAITSCGARVRGMDASVLVLLAQLRHLTTDKQRRSGASAANLRLLTRLRTTLDAAVQSAAPLSLAGLAFGLGTMKRDKVQIKKFLQHARRLVDRSPTTVRFVDEILRDTPAIPAERALSAYVTLRRWMIPRRIALRIAAR